MRNEVVPENRKVMNYIVRNEDINFKKLHTQKLEFHKETCAMKASKTSGAGTEDTYILKLTSSHYRS